jgi:imidazolonepropionase-like amidohydrolase
MIRGFIKSIALAAAVCSIAGPATAQSTATGTTLFRNVRIFDGTGTALSAPSDVLVRGNRIERISSATTAPDANPGDVVIDGGGRTLMPGMIDAHWHTLLLRPRFTELLTVDESYLNVLGAAEATATLMRGFTSVRDMGGGSFGLKRAIDEGVVPGPRIYPSGAMISVTSGHGDFRQAWEVPRAIGAPDSRGEMVGAAMIADGPDEVTVRVREQLMQGATQIKLTAGGGVSSPHSPIDASTFTEAELRAAVEAAGNWGTYVAVHAYTPTSIQRAIAAGVKCIEHGHLMDDATARMIAEKGVWLSMQPLPDELAEGFPPGSEQRAKAVEVFAGTAKTYAFAKKYGIKTAWGTDLLFAAPLAKMQGALLAKIATWFTPAEALAQATGTNARLLALSGERNPYKGKLGVVEEGAFADLLLVDGNPIEDIALVADPDRNFLVIMKDGTIYKNTMAATR